MGSRIAGGSEGRGWSERCGSEWKWMARRGEVGVVWRGFGSIRHGMGSRIEIEGA